MRSRATLTAPSNRRMRLSSTSLAAFVVACLCWTSAWGQQQNTFPGVRIFETNFDLRELNRPEIEDVKDLLRFLGLVPVYSNNAPERLREILASTGTNLPEFMEAVLGAGGSSDGDRYLRLRYQGGNALLTSRDALPVIPGARVRITAQARWDELGGGHWEALLRFADGSVASLYVGRDAASEWKQIGGENIVPAGNDKAWLEIWLHGYRGAKQQGELGLDEIVVETLPRVGVVWNGASRRIDVTDESPFDLKSFALPSAEEPYEMHLEILDRTGRRLHAEDRNFLITKEYPLDYSPRFSWDDLSISRGIYQLQMSLRSPQGYQLTESRAFALAGTPIFRYAPGPVQWGVELRDASKRPLWFDAVAPQRVLIHLSPDNQPQDLLPAWLPKETKSVVNAVLAQPSRWNVKKAKTLAPLVEDVLAWYWRGDPQAGKAFFDALRGLAPYLVVGQELAPGAAPTATPQTAPRGNAEVLVTPAATMITAGELLPFLAGAGDTHVSRIQLPAPSTAPDAPVWDPHQDLARRLYTHAAAQPRAVFVQALEGLFLEHTVDGGILPTRSLLTWEFVVSFLSGASFVRVEEWDPNGICLAFRRDGAEYVAFFTDGADHTLTLHGGGNVRAFDSVGAPVTIASAGATVTIPVTRDPLLVAGLDLARIRTRRSLVAVSEGLIRNTDKQAVKISLTNHFPDVVRASFDAKLPKGWELDAPPEPRRLDPSSAHQWTLGVHVPPDAGVSVGAFLEGQLELELVDGERIQLPIRTPIPIKSSLVEIRSIGLGNEDADIVVRNLTDEPLRANVYLAVAPDGSDLVRRGEVLPPGVERTYQIRYPMTEGTKRQLLVSVSIPSRRAFANRVFDLP
ncbi:MAG: hypothetical protein AAF581_10655 [Planctomycetota bacterium]